MIKVAENIELEAITEGLIPDGVVSHYAVPKSSVDQVSNFNNDTIGVMTFRPNLPGFINPTGNVLSAAIFQTIPGETRLYWQEGQSLLFNNAEFGGSTTTYAGVFPPGSFRARYQIIQGNLLMTAGNTISLTDGSAAPTNISGISYPPVTIDLLNAGFQGRLWYARSEVSNRLYYSDVIPTAGVGSTTGTSQFLVINANNGDGITALVGSQQVLFVFTQNSIFRVYNTQSQDNSPVSNVGALNQEAIATAQDGVYFYHPTGFYKLNVDGSAQNISNRIVSELPTSNRDTCRSWADGDHVYFAFSFSYPIGAGTRTGTKVYRYTISTQVWSIYDFVSLSVTATAYGINRSGTSYPFLLGNSFDFSVRFASPFREDPSAFGSVGSQGFNQDLSTYDIVASYTTHYENFGIEHRLKQIQGIAVPHLNATGFDISYQVDTDNPSEWRPIGALKSDSVTLFKDFQSVPFRRIRFRVTGSRRSAPSGTQCWIRNPILIKVSDVGI